MQSENVARVGGGLKVSYESHALSDAGKEQAAAAPNRVASLPPERRAQRQLFT